MAGAIDRPTLTMTRSHVKTKSASLEAHNQPTIRCSSLNLFDDDCNEDENSNSFAKCINKNKGSLEGDHLAIVRDEDLIEEQQSSNSNQTKQARDNNFLSVAPGFGLKPSASTSCLFTACGDETSSKSGSSSSLICIPTRASLTHEWKKLKTPSKCRECNLLVYFNGRECSFCGFIAHKKCVTILVIKCSGQQVAHCTASSGSKRGTEQKKGAFRGNATQKANQQHQSKSKNFVQRPVFGKPIDVDREQVLDFIRRFVYEIDSRGLTSKGIYRVSSIKSKVDRLCNYYDQNLSSLIDLSSFHPNIIANALKMYLRKLPEPLLTDQLYGKFIELAKKYSTPTCSANFQSASSVATNLQQRPQAERRYRSPSSALLVEPRQDPTYDPVQIAEFKEVIEELPPINCELVAIIMRHLRRVANMSDENQMSAKNLSIIFGPTLLNASNKSLALVDSIHQARAVELMITWADQIFPQYASYESKAVIELNRPTAS